MTFPLIPQSLLPLHLLRVKSHSCHCLNLLSYSGYRYNPKENLKVKPLDLYKISHTMLLQFRVATVYMQTDEDSTVADACRNGIA